MLDWMHIFDFSRSVLPMITLTVFLIGVILRITKWVSFGLPKEPKKLPPKSNRLIAVIKNWSIEMIPPWDLSGRLAWAEDIAGITMHVTCIMILLGAIHAASILNIIDVPFQTSTFRLPIIPPSNLPISIPRWILTFIVTPIFLSTLAILILRRADHYVTGGPLKLLTLKTDWIASILLWFAGFTGFLAVIAVEPYQQIMTIHLILTQLFIMYLPYGKLVHSASVFLVRTWYGLKRGRYGV